MKNWFITAYEQIQLDDGFRVEFYTNVPCHLYCYWTKYEPWVHRASGQRRGLLYKFFQYFCFVSWKKLDQTDPGDTLFHSFTLDNWPACETRWFVFHGTIANEKSPSVSPIFEKHNAYIRPRPTIPLCYRKWWTTGNTYDISDLLWIAQINRTFMFPWYFNSGDLYFNSTPDAWVLVSIFNVDENDNPTGYSLCSRWLNLKDGERYCHDNVFRNHFTLNVTIPADTHFALIARCFTGTVQLWRNFPTTGWECEKVRWENFTVTAKRSIDGGVSWTPATSEICFYTYGYIPPHD